AKAVRNDEPKAFRTPRLKPCPDTNRSHSALLEEDALDAAGVACGGVAINDYGGEAGIVFCGLEACRHVGEEALQDGVFSHANHAVVRAGHAYVGLVGGALGQHALVGGGNVSVSADDSGDAAIE